MFNYSATHVISANLLRPKSLKMKKKHSRVALRDIRSLTLHSSNQTTALRASAIPQLNCVGPQSLCRQSEPSVVYCWNNGGDGIEFDWTVRFIFTREACCRCTKQLSLV